MDISSLIKHSKAVWGQDHVRMKMAVTQAIHESNYVSKNGPSSLAKHHNNLFGIKGSGTAGSVWLPTWEMVNGKVVQVKAKFAKNLSISDSFRQHYNLMHKKRYRRVLKEPNIELTFVRLYQAGYATDEGYANKLVLIYRQYVRDQV